MTTFYILLAATLYAPMQAGGRSFPRSFSVTVCAAIEDRAPGFAKAFVAEDMPRSPSTIAIRETREEVASDRQGASRGHRRGDDARGLQPEIGPVSYRALGISYGASNAISAAAVDIARVPSSRRRLAAATAGPRRAAALAVLEFRSASRRTARGASRPASRIDRRVRHGAATPRGCLP